LQFQLLSATASLALYHDGASEWFVRKPCHAGVRALVVQGGQHKRLDINAAQKYGRQMEKDRSDVLRTQYRFPWRTVVCRRLLRRIGFTFKEGKGRSDDEKALPALQTYFGLIRNTGKLSSHGRTP
jgi:hypothetical protein